MTGQAGHGRRVRDATIQAVGKPLVFQFDGEPIEALRGESVAAAVTASGGTVFGTRRSGAPQGIFCGMGVCQECLVTIDGQPSRRACMTSVAEGLDVRSQPYAVTPGPAPPPVKEPRTKTLHPDVLVVGAGPAGLAAARAAALCGATVAVVDERTSFGGQYFKQLAPSHQFQAGFRPDPQYSDGSQLIETVRAMGVALIGGVTIWGAFGPKALAAQGPDGPLILAPATLILATGAYERVAPFPGWTLPGVMTTGAAQSFLRRYRVAPGRRVLIAGNGPLNLQVAVEMAEAGIDIAGVVEAAGKPGLRQAPAAIRATLASPDLVLQGLAYLRRLRRANVPVLYGALVGRAEGENGVERVEVSVLDPSGRPMNESSRDFDVDTLCLGQGFLPSNEVARSLGCAHRFDGRRNALVAVTDENGQSSVPEVFIVGDSAALNGARAALENGFIAGCAAARLSGRAATGPIEAELSRAHKRQGRHRRFQEALWALYRAPWPGLGLAEESTLVCRCECVPLSEVREAIRAGADTIGEVKRRTRLGMGRCQGRYCSAQVVALLRAQNGSTIDELDGQAPRAPMKPLPIGCMATPHDP